MGRASEYRQKTTWDSGDEVLGFDSTDSNAVVNFTQAALGEAVSGAYVAKVSAGSSIQDAIDAGAKRVVVSGTHTLSTGLSIPSDCVLDLSDAKLVAADSTNISLIANDDPTGGNSNITIIGGELDGNDANQNGDDLKFGVLMTRVTNLTIRGMDIHDIDGTGLRVTGDGSVTHTTKLSDIYAHDNTADGVKVMHASRFVQVANVIASDNGRHGVVVDHSEGQYSNINADGNTGYGFWIRNIFGGSYSNIAANRNGFNGIKVSSMVAAVGSNWHAHNNSDGNVGTYDDVLFDADDLGYGVTQESVVDGVNAGYWSQYDNGGGRDSKYGVFVTDGVSDSLILKNVWVSTGNVGDYYRARTEVVDGFDRADSTSVVGTSPTGHLWTSLSGTWGISGGKAYAVGGAADMVATFDAGYADIDMTVDLTWGSNARIPFRVVDATNYLCVTPQGSGEILQKVAAGAETSLASHASSPSTAGQLSRYRIRALGDVVKVWRDGVLIFEVTLSSGDQTAYGSATKHGVAAASAPGATTRWDNIVCRKATAAVADYGP